jgi:hypothetical protein
VYLTLYDTFGMKNCLVKCSPTAAALTLNLEPYLLSAVESQWIEDVSCAQQVLHADYGISLQILFCVAKVRTWLPAP